MIQGLSRIKARFVLVEFIEGLSNCMNTYHIHITGQVQGVGFRPYVYVLAKDFGLTGWVKNSIDGVHIVINADKTTADDFYKTVLEKAPRLAIITDHQMESIENQIFTAFEIDHSDEIGLANLLVTPDFAICPDCQKEMEDKANRRYEYPFITCTNCGPRFSIIKALPYDRPYTTMDTFVMCPDCRSEYDDPLDRRYFSQTNSCPACAVSLLIKSKNPTGNFRNIATDDRFEQINLITSFLNDGKIIAIKGIGGFLLVCDASNPSVIKTLRERKHRPTKAFAVMYPDADAVQRDFIVGENALEFMTGPVSPIVLLRTIAGKKPEVITELIAPGLSKVGVMLPYTPLFVLIVQSFRKPVVATSGNLSGSPIVFENHLAEEYLGKIADVIVENDRDIIIPQDDSVIQYSDRYGQKIILRRSRGLAPNYVDGALELPDEQILAVGAELKSTFAHLFNRLLFISQYLGDQATYETKRVFEQNVRHCIRLFGSKPARILHDIHPGYLSTQFAAEIAKKNGISLYGIQHHEAHFAAVLGEHKLFGPDHAVLGVIWDGVGYGTDGHVWGGEFFGYHQGKINRLYHIPYFDFILGDKMPREPRISALSISGNNAQLLEMIREKFTQTEWKIYLKMLGNGSTLKSSSMGRFFDAAASLILGIDRQSYEGEAAMMLESCATEVYLSDHSVKKDYLQGSVTGENDVLGAILNGVCFDLKNGLIPGEIALNVHYSLVMLIKRKAIELGFSQLALSGGVFQNALLADLLIEELGDGFTLYFHQKLSPNDECISFGQMMHHIFIDAV